MSRPMTRAYARKTKQLVGSSVEHSVNPPDVVITNPSSLKPQLSNPSLSTPPPFTHPPRRLTFLLLHGCDFCPSAFCDKCLNDGENNNISTIGDIHTFGWQYCGCCQEKLNTSRKYYIIEEEIIEKQLGPSFRVLRSSGDFDIDKWSIWYCCRGKIDGNQFDVLLKSKDMYLTKGVNLNDLFTWNGKTFTHE